MEPDHRRPCQTQKKFGLYSKCKGMPLGGFQQEGTESRLCFLKARPRTMRKTNYDRADWKQEDRLRCYLIRVGG